MGPVFSLIFKEPKYFALFFSFGGNEGKFRVRPLIINLILLLCIFRVCDTLHAFVIFTGQLGK